MHDSGDLVLQFDLEEGRNADAIVAAESLLAWVDLARDAARAIDPEANVRIELIGREKGSLKQILKIVDDNLRLVSEGADEFPYLKKTAIGLAIGIATSTMPVFVEKALGADVQEIAMSDKDRAIFQGLTEVIRENTQVAESARRFYQKVEKDRAITKVVVVDSVFEVPLVTVPRSEFALRGGLFSPEAEPPREEPRRATYDVLLRHAPFYATPRHWGFSRDGVPFSAQMADLDFLQAIVDRRLPINLRDGVMMRVQVEWKERQAGEGRDYIPDTRKIVKVLAPLPTTGAPHAPEEHD